MTRDLQTAFKTLGKRGVDTFPAEVISVDKTNGTCVVSDGSLEYDDVQLSATIEENGKRFFLFPKIGSYVLVSPINEDIHRLYVEFFSEIEDFDLNIGTTQLQIDNGGFLLKKENETLKKIMIDLLQEIQNMKFTTNTGSTIVLINKVKFLGIENRVKDFLK
ncbi:hypothetical protein LJF28_04800 [Chryseobacterium indologenes]|uniref:hypothetical protein n=1 Tax=Chryseobacterium indologenes TaxID=253 RepID=UPI001D0D5B64|nr:hypothetical protein [Chryseobacterium indologenes]UDQ54988.1 hypothetical protein LJF28_04800 [Chryseobacterium indologenes]